ncbi:MAG: amidohydrolase [Acidobacteria bacterium 13_1_40CM_65_14]|nr:MAG: amidohydrolase [Acidobacteria bacterium 13_1_40CM_65_14]OLE82953.1 MAG: amidohydrolase [Acidobacteria bacterium 13_1_20CM_2_65_9]
MPGAQPSASAQTPQPPQTTSGGEPDLIVVNGNVLTSETAQPRAEAFAVKNGRFVAVGSNADVRNLATRRTQVIDAERMTVTPGFIDAHSHPSGVQELYGVNTNLRTVREIQAAIKRKADNTAPETWVVGFMFDDTKLDRPLTRKDLDEATTEHPVSVAHRGGHTNFYNSKAFELAGITNQTPDPPDGRFFRENGELNGRVAENARNVFNRVGTRETFTPEQQRDRARKGMAHMSRLFNAAGLTSVHNAGTSQDAILAYEDCRRNGELTHRAYMMIRSQPAFNGLKAANIYTGFGDEWIRVGGVKFVADGSASERTMRMSTPYVGTNDYGILTMTQDQLYEAIDDAHSHNFQVGVHANGDVTIDMVLKAYERALQKWPDPNRRHRIEHCTLVNPDLIRRIKANGVIPTPFWTYVYYHGEKWSEYGDEKVKWMFAHRSFLDAGIRVPGASDYTPGPFEPMMAIQSMVTRTDYKGRVWGANQKVTVDEALVIATINGAYASSEENLKGSMTAGKLADFVFLEKDPHVVPPNEIMNIKVNRTVVGGKTVYPVERT